jgi:ABC-2 type transport system permease protein
MKNKSLYTVLTFVRINTKRFFRDRLALFFTIVFPLIFLFVFGGLNSGNSDVSFKVALINHSDS